MRWSKQNISLVKIPLALAAFMCFYASPSFLTVGFKDLYLLSLPPNFGRFTFVLVSASFLDFFTYRSSRKCLHRCFPSLMQFNNSFECSFGGEHSYHQSTCYVMQRCWSWCFLWVSSFINELCKLIVQGRTRMGLQFGRVTITIANGQNLMIHQRPF